MALPKYLRVLGELDHSSSPHCQAETRPLVAFCVESEDTRSPVFDIAKKLFKSIPKFDQRFAYEDFGPFN